MSIEVAVTGLGVVSPFGWGVEPFWEGLVAGASALRPIRRFATVPEGGRGGEVVAPELDAVPRSAVGRRMDWASRMAVGACRLALADAGLEPAAILPVRTAIALGSAFGNLQETATFLDRLFDKGAGNPLVFPNLVFNAPLSYAAIELGVTGETAMLSMLEASGEAAIGWGAHVIAGGRAECCLAGGVDELGAVLHRLLTDAGVLARDVPRPFDREADGAAPGEGAAVLVLEALPRAVARGARVYARVVPGASGVVAAPVHGWPRDHAALAARLAPVLRGADVVFASACGDPARDAAEAAALDGVDSAVTAIRGAIGEFGAAGALAAAAAARAVAAGVVPPTLGLRRPLRAGLDIVTGSARRSPVRAAVLPGLARGGLCRPLRLEAP